MDFGTGWGIWDGKGVGLYARCVRGGLSQQPNKPPSPPVLVSPSNDSQNVNPNNVVFSWQSSLDPEGDDVQYCVTVKEVLPPNLVPRFMGCDDNSFTPYMVTNYPLTDALDGGKTYWWSVKARDSHGNLSDESDWWSLSTIPPPIPIANAGGDQFPVVGHQVILDGTRSSSSNSQPLSYRWCIVRKPPFSSAVISLPDQPKGILNPDIVGIYEISLVVNDGSQDSLADNATIWVITKQEAATQTLQDVIAKIQSIPENHFKGPKEAGKLVEEINKVNSRIAEGKYKDALDRLTKESGVLDRINGCKGTEKPDKNDWITNCEDQLIIYFEVISCIAYVEALLDINVKYNPDAAIKLALSTQIGTTLKLYIEYLHANDLIALIPFNWGGWGLTYFDEKYIGEADGNVCKFINLYVFLNTNQSDTEWLAFTLIHEVTHYSDYVLASKRNYPFNIANNGDLEIHAYANQYSFYQELKQRPEYAKNKLLKIVEKDGRSGSLELWKLCYEVGSDPAKKLNALAAIARFAGGTVEDLNKTIAVSCGP